MTSIFFKHLFASIRKRPMQPILLILVIALSVAVCITAFHTRLYLNEESRSEISAKNGVADFTVTFSSDSPIRFLFESDIQEIVGDESVVCGTFSVPIYYGENEEFYYGVATDFSNVSNVFNIDFTEVRPLQKYKFATSAFITEEFAQENGILIGDSIELSVMGVKNEYLVVGISPRSLLGDYSIMIDMSSIVRIIAKNSIITMLLGSEFMPSTKLFVRVNGNVNDAINNVITNDEYENVIITRITSDDNEERSVFDSASKTIVLLIIILAVIFTFAVIYVCFAVLTAQRQSENALFYAAGAKAYMLNTLSIAEMFLYWFIGGLVGVGLSYAVAQLYISVGNFKYCTAFVETWTIFAALGITLLAAEISMGFFILLDYFKKKKPKKKSVKKEFKAGIWIFVGLLALTLLFAALIFIENIEVKKVIGICGIVILMATVFYGTRLLLPKFANVISKQKLPVSLRYAVKNASKVESLANTSSVVALLIVVMFAIMVIYAYSVKSIDHDLTYFAGDYLVENLTDSGILSLYKNDDVEDVYGVFFDNAHKVDDDYTYVFISADSVDAIAPHLGFDTMPEGNGVYMCEELALHANLKLGDTFVVNMRGVDYEMQYVGNIPAGGSRMFFNYVDMGLSPTCHEVIGREGISSENLKGSIASTLAFENATIIPATALTKSFVDTSERYVVCIEFIAVFLLIFSFIGIIDNIVSSYKSRNEEFACFRSAGMENKKIRSMIASELTFANLFAFVVALIGSGIVFVYIYQVLRAFSDNLFYVF